MKFIFKYLIVALLLCSTVQFAQSQNRADSTAKKDKPSFAERLYFGGDLGLSFGRFTFINVAPIVGYKITDNFSAGLGAKYQYIAYSDGNYRESTSVYGGSVFIRQIFSEQFFGHAEFEVLNTEVFDYIALDVGRRNVPIFMIGAGYRQEISTGVFAQLMILYDLIDDPYSPYPSYYGRPIIIRGGVTFGR
jgi:hypothetical protein